MKTTFDWIAIQKTIALEHAQNPHPGLDDRTLRMHLLIHALVEKQLAEKDPPEVATTLERLITNGCSRHEAVHTIGKAIAKEAFQMLNQNRPLDQQAYLKKLAELSSLSGADDSTPKQK